MIYDIIYSLHAEKILAFQQPVVRFYYIINSFTLGSLIYK